MVFSAFLQLILILAAVIFLGLLVYRLWYFYQANQRAVLQEKFAHARRIIEAGGPHNRQEYFDIFPEACPRCGGRTRHEDSRGRACVRCQYSQHPSKNITGGERYVSSPYLPTEVADALPELPFSGLAYKQIFLEDDNATPMEVVVDVLQRVFEMPQKVAVATMLETHFKGQSYVITLPTEEAETKVYLAIGITREKGYPLIFIIRDNNG